MGFGFDDLFEVVGGIADIFTPGGGAIIAGAGELLGIIDPTEEQLVKPAAAITSAVGGAIASITSGKVVSGTRMKNFVRTIVQTIDPSGKVVRQETLDGAPWLMRKDFVVMKRVLRTLESGEKKVPRRTSKSPKKDKDLATALGMLKGLMASGRGVPLIANIDND